MRVGGEIKCVWCVCIGSKYNEGWWWQERMQCKKEYKLHSQPNYHHPVSTYSINLFSPPALLATNPNPE
jgi:hypothetical protein